MSDDSPIESETLMEKTLLQSLENDSLAPAMPAEIANALAETVIGPLADLHVYPRSITAANHGLYFLGRRDTQKYAGLITTEARRASVLGTPRSIRLDNTGCYLALTKADKQAAGVMQDALSFLRPRVIGVMPSVGCGDRLGIATAGHLQAVARSRMAPILAQQSVRENERTGRSPRDVMTDAVVGVFQEGWRRGFGADADHLKTSADIDAFAAAGFTFFTIDPGDHVDARADDATPGELAGLFQNLPWDRLESTPADLVKSLTATPIALDTGRIEITEDAIYRAAVKYGRVIAHTVAMYRHLVDHMAGRPFELEVSVDETDTVTSLTEHIYIASELKRLGVRWISLAPRYVGEFEKGVDYIGDLEVFATSFAQHAAVAHAFGPYKLSLHSGSDKFSIYPIASRLAGDHVHLKTAGTSYLEALRAVARVAPDVFRKIVDLAIERYPVDRASYHVSAEIAALEPVLAGPDEGLGVLLDDFHGREILHVTYGSVLNHPSLGAMLFEILTAHEDLYTELVARHFDRHLKPFGG
jgi:hypothetical protein